MEHHRTLSNSSDVTITASPDLTQQKRRTVLWLLNQQTWSFLQPLIQQVAQEFNVVPLTTGDAGLTAAVYHHEIDFIITPGLGWTEIITTLRRIKPNTPIVVFEATSNPLVVQSFISAGATWHTDHINQLARYMRESVALELSKKADTLFVSKQTHTTDDIVWPNEGDTVFSASLNISYTLLNKLGEGSFGYVFRCVDSFGQHYVVKTLKPIQSKERTQKDWIKEARFLLNLRHPSIIQLYDMFEYNSLFYLVMEEADGTLKGYVERHGPMRLQEVIQTAGQLLSGIHHMHERGVIHRDLQTDNILYKYMESRASKDLHVKITDFGISKFSQRGTDGNLLAYTSIGRDYDVSPELVTLGYTTSQSDIYQLGLVLYYLYQGTPALGPNDGKSSEAIVKGVARSRAEAIGTPLGNVIARMLRRRAEWRFKNSAEVWVELKAAEQAMLRDAAADGFIDVLEGNHSLLRTRTGSGTSSPSLHHSGTPSPPLNHSGNMPMHGGMQPTVHVFPASPHQSPMPGKRMS